MSSGNIALEVCVASDDLTNLPAQMQAVYQGGATRVELCADMAQEGLSPAMEAIHLARETLHKSVELLVMVRPRGGDFCYSQTEIATMEQYIEQAARAGADGVVFGVLDPLQQLALAPLKQLVYRARQAHLNITFHRAFDALQQPVTAIEPLVDLGIGRVLSSGTQWGSGKAATEGIASLQHFIQHSRGRIELVVGGGVNLQNLPELKQALCEEPAKVSFHCHSAVVSGGLVNADKLRRAWAILGQ